MVAEKLSLDKRKSSISMLRKISEKVGLIVKEEVVTKKKKLRKSSPLYRARSSLFQIKEKHFLKKGGFC